MQISGTEKQAAFAATIIDTMASVDTTPPELSDPSSITDAEDPSGDRRGQLIRSNQLAKAAYNEAVSAQAAGQVLDMIRKDDHEGADALMVEADSDATKREYMGLVAACFKNGSLDANSIIDRFKSVFCRIRDSW